MHKFNFSIHVPFHLPLISFIEQQRSVSIDLFKPICILPVGVGTHEGCIKSESNTSGWPWVVSYSYDTVSYDFFIALFCVNHHFHTHVLYYFVSHYFLYFEFIFIASIFDLRCHKKYPIFVMLPVVEVIDCHLQKNSNMM